MGRSRSASGKHNATCRGRVSAMRHCKDEMTPRNEGAVRDMPVVLPVGAIERFEHVSSFSSVVSAYRGGG